VLSDSDSVVLEVGESVGNGIILMVTNLVIQLEWCSVRCWLRYWGFHLEGQSVNW